MEDSQINFGKIDTSPTGLLHLLVAEFGLTCSNDWFMLPYELPVGTLCEIKGIVVTDVFGQYILISPAGAKPESQWQRWAMFHHTETNPDMAATNNRLYVVPALATSLEGAPVEKVKFLRDEMANMAWAVEAIVPSQAGKGVSGDEMALVRQEDKPAPTAAMPATSAAAPAPTAAAPATSAAGTPAPAAPATSPAGPLPNATVPATSAAASPAPAAAIAYQLGTTVPDNWIPFIPVHLPDNNTEIQLQRAKMPGSRGASGTLLTEKAAPYYIHEEIIQRSGANVTISFQVAASPSGKRNCWLGRKKLNGSGEGWSNLQFDQIVNKE